MHNCVNLAYVIKYIFKPSLWNIDNIAPLVVNIYLGLWPREIFLPSVQYLSIFHAEGWNIYTSHVLIMHNNGERASPVQL